MKKYILKTNDGTTWIYDNKEDARRDKYIFGGTITEIKINNVVDDEPNRAEP